MTRSATEKAWTAHGLDCEVKMVFGTHRCGYVTVPAAHPWHGVNYNDAAPVALPHDLDYVEVGEDIGTVAAFCYAISGDDRRSEYERTPEFQVSVHGGLTFSGADGDGWTFGFDCAHLDDTPAVWTLDRTAAECERLAEQLARLMVLA